MNKGKTFKDIMVKPDAEQQDEIWKFVMETAKIFEEELGFSRQTVCEGLLRATMDLAERRMDERYFRKKNDIRYFLLWASEFTKQRFDTFTSYKVQRALDKKYGKDSLHLRDYKGCGAHDEETHH